ncbi:MAG: porin family protein [Spirochaetia bacterium]|nr:porin family protein [Spirochaetia bacterium]
MKNTIKFALVGLLMLTLVRPGEAAQMSVTPFLSWGILTSPDIPDNDKSSGGGVNIGADFHYSINKNMSVGAELGYLSIYDYEDVYASSSISAIPILGLFKYSLKIPLSFQAGLGVYYTMGELSITIPLFGTTTTEVSETEIGLFMGAEYEVAKNISAFMRYNHITTEGDAFATLSIGAGYKIGL